MQPHEFRINDMRTNRLSANNDIFFYFTVLLESIQEAFSSTVPICNTWLIHSLGIIGQHKIFLSIMMSNAESHKALNIDKDLL